MVCALERHDQTWALGKSIGQLQQNMSSSGERFDTGRPMNRLFPQPRHEEMVSPHQSGGGLTGEKGVDARKILMFDVARVEMLILGN